MTQPKADARPAPPSLTAALSSFTPAQLQRQRSSGWTPDRQRKFIEALASCACVTEAAASVGLSATAAYNLRRRPDAAAFRHAWDAAIDFGMRRLVDAALARAVHGVAVPIFYKGEQVGERREYPEHLAMFLMRAHDPDRFGAQPAATPRPFDAAGQHLAQAIDHMDAQAKPARCAPPPRLTAPGGESANASEGEKEDENESGDTAPKP
ncbi:MAG: hypothetical protein U0S50_02950 [Sphingopyxis sp.]|uniref:hypothetical protein n=1 Tax=Sphingopyxis sp. TaxID=1908224 RepID=UPI002AB819D6|nr:hypothetical protein [Sphingopyxis sp.]MDZ3830761.1 hypothetical protein [Sphingopyxis sp.]